MCASLSGGRSAWRAIVGEAKRAAERQRRRFDQLVSWVGMSLMVVAIVAGSLVTWANAEHAEGRQPPLVFAGYFWAPIPG